MQKRELNLEKNNIINDGRSVLNVVQKRESNLEKNNIINDGRSVLNVGQKLALKPRKEQHNK